MYVCLCVCIAIYLYVCMYVCMYVICDLYIFAKDESDSEASWGESS